MKRFSISTEKSLFKPLEIEIDGEVYQVRKLTRPLLNELRELDKKVRRGDVDAAYRQIVLLTGVDMKKIENVDFCDINALLEHVTEAVFNRERMQSEDEKNGLGPGEKGLQK